MVQKRAGRPPESWQSALEGFLKNKRLEERTKQKYRWNYTRFFTALEKAGLKTLPREIGATEINYLLDVEWKDILTSTQEWYTKIFAMLLRFYGNNIVNEMKIQFPTDMRINVDWLSPMETVDLMDLPMTPLQLLVTHLELVLMLRRIDCIRLKLKDIGKNEIHVIKGKGGKSRTVPFHPDTRQVLDTWIKQRKAMVAEARIYKPDIEVPDNLIIYKRYKYKPVIGSYAEDGSGLDDAVHLKLKEIAGFDYSNHTLRRTGGRLLWKHGKIPIETISKIYGHSDTETTKDYIGVNYDDMSEAMEAMTVYQEQFKKMKQEIRGKNNGS